MTTQAVQIGSCTPAFSGCCEVGKNLRRPGCQLAFWSSLRTLNVSGDAFRSSSLAGKTAGTFHCQRRREALVVRVRNGGKIQCLKGHFVRSRLFLSRNE